MNENAILSFSSPISEASRVQAVPSPVLELAYVFYFLQSRDARKQADTLPWVKLLFDEHQELVSALRDFWPSEERKGASADLLWMACDIRFVHDADAGKFLAALPTLPELLLQRMAEEVKQWPSEKSEGKLEQWQATQRRLERLTEPQVIAAYRDLLGRLWQVLEPLWKREGLALAQQAAATFMARFQETQDVLAGIPAHHFTQHEDSAKHIRASQEKGKVLVVPLYFAAEGGLNFDMPEMHFIGYGIQSERVFESLTTRVNKVANQMKSFADPTRLMLLALIAKHAHAVMSVGDLAAQLGVSQPTVSGHLKVLRDVGMVKVEKQGNKSLYQIAPEALREALAEVEALTLDR